MTTRSEYWEKIPLWKNDGKRFEVMADDYSGRIPVTRVEHWSDFISLLGDDFFNRPDAELIFRGHRRHDWGMVPTLSRLRPTGIIDEKLATEQLDLFRKAIRAHINNKSLLLYENQDDELWSIGQHHGLMTPLLDWTYSAYVALFFAFLKENQKNEDINSYRAVYVLNKSFVKNNKLCTDIRLIEPKTDDYGRLVHQQGLFTFPPYDATIENKLTDILSSDEFYDENLRIASGEEEAEIIAKYICKIYIKNKDRPGCLKNLNKMNINHGFLFPDIIGASKHCNDIITIKENERSTANKSRIFKSINGETDDASGFSSEESNSDKRDVNYLINLSKEPEESHKFVPGRINFITTELSDQITKMNLMDLQTHEKLLNGESDNTSGFNSEESISDKHDVNSLINLLKEPEISHELEPERINLIATKLLDLILKKDFVDWDTRETIRAEIRNATRLLLRKYSYPVSARNYVVENIISETEKMDEKEELAT